MAMTSTPIHVVQVISSLDNEAAGTTAWVRQLVEHLHIREIDVDVLALLLAEAAPEALNGLSLHLPDKSRLQGLGALLGSRTMKQAVLAAAEKGHVLHSSGLWRLPNVYPGWAAARTGCPLVVSPHGMLGPGALQFSSRKKRLFAALAQNRALAAVTCFHATSQKEVEDIRNYGLKTPIALIPIGIDVPENVTETSHGSPGAPARRTLLYLGRVHPKKGLDRLVEAWSRVEQRFSNWQLSIVGPSEIGYGDLLRAQVRRAGANRVEFSDGLFGDEKLKAYRDADLFVLPTLDENFGMVVAESLANGTPVVCTKGAPWEGLERHGCGWWIDHGVEPLAGALSEAMSLPRAQLKAMGARGRDWMISDFSWRGIAADMEHLYRWCKSRGDAPPAFVTFD
jgi:glycosyltransferase involved in cell wall biosynthesis